MTIKTDNTFYTIFVRNRAGAVYSPEQTPEAMCDRAGIVSDITGGAFEDVVVAVHAHNPAEGWSRDMSEDIARECAALVEFRMDPPSYDLQEFVERHAGFGLMRRAA